MRCFPGGSAAKAGLVTIPALLVMMLTVCGHGDVHAQVERITAQIQQSPKDVELYLRRARLHHLHEDWPAAAADFDQAEILLPTLDGIHLGRGQMWLSAGRLLEARAELDRFLAQKPDHVEGLITRARIEARNGEPRTASTYFLRALKLTPHPEPEYYVECARSLAAIDGDHLAEAVAVLDRGLTKLGNLPSLGLLALDYEIQLGRFDAALDRIQKLSAASPRREIWLARRGDVLHQAGRVKEAAESYRAARAAIAQLPAHVRGRPATVDLAATVNHKLAALSANPAADRPE